MGTITRAAANNITTGGVILPTAINDASVASITALAQVSAGDGITLISSQTASSSASLSFTTGIDSTYRIYLFKFISIHPASGGNFLFNMSTDGGSNYNVTKTSTAFKAQHSEAGANESLNYDDGVHLTQSTSYKVLVENTGADADLGCSGYLYLFNPSSTTYVKHFMSTISMTNGVLPRADVWYMAGYGNTTSAINAIDFKMTSGNIDDGTIQMFGIL